MRLSAFNRIQIKYLLLLSLQLQKPKMHINKFSSTGNSLELCFNSKFSFLAQSKTTMINADY